jgi:Ca2+:H+ antiporter
MQTSNSNFYLPQQEEAAAEEEDEKEITQGEAICWLFILTIWISVLSGYLVDAIQVLKSLLTITFICSLLLSLLLVISRKEDQIYLYFTSIYFSIS